MSASPWLLADSTWADVVRQSYDVAILPWGATEAHNRHLPYGTDVIETSAVGSESARLAWERGARVVVLPAVPFGVQTGQREVPFCLNMNPSTQAAVLADLVASLEAHGVRKLVLLNGHGGNDFRAIIRELQPRTAIFLSLINWYTVVDAATFFDEPGDHAGEMETSLMMHLAPTTVRPLDTAGPGAARGFRLRGLRDGTAWAPRHWISVTDDTGVGDPRRSTAAKGARYYEAVTRKISDYLVELAAADPRKLYEP